MSLAVQKDLLRKIPPFGNKINYIIKIETISGRLMYITLNFSIPICIICAYAPTAKEATPEEQEILDQKKDIFYKQIETLIQKMQKSYINIFKYLYISLNTR